jgi:hypothetical protein
MQDLSRNLRHGEKWSKYTDKMIIPAMEFERCYNIDLTLHTKQYAR